MNALYVICGLSFLSLVAEIANFKKGLSALNFLGLLVAAGLIIFDWNTSLSYYGDMLVFDNFAVAFTALIIVISIFWFWMADVYFKNQPHQTDRSALILFVVVGAVIMTSFSNMVMLFLGIEILSISLYALAGSNKESLFSNEASFKYFLMGSFATGFLLMGIALIYGATGSFNLAKIAEVIATNNNLPGFFYTGVLMMLVGMAFKISAVPFHFWAPDVYEGSPVPITAFMSTVVKIAAVAAFYKLFSYTFIGAQSTWLVAVQIITILTLIVPNVTAVYQVSVKRILAYSSVGQVGYLLLVFITNSESSLGITFFYLSSYAVASIAAFSVVQKVENDHGFAGLAKRNPLLALTMTVALLSLAGIPPLAGFFGKYMIFAKALENGYVGLVILAVVTSLIGAYYYLRVLLTMFLKESEGGEIALSASYRILLMILLALTVLIGLFPSWLLQLFA